MKATYTILNPFPLSDHDYSIFSDLQELYPDIFADIRDAASTFLKVERHATCNNKEFNASKFREMFFSLKMAVKEQDPYQ